MEVKIARPCHCVKKNDLPETVPAADRAEALQKAGEILELLKAKSCHAHRFFIKEEADAVVIDSTFNDDIISL